MYAVGLYTRVLAINGILYTANIRLCLPSRHRTSVLHSIMVMQGRGDIQHE